MTREEFVDNLRNIIRVLEGKGMTRDEMHFSWDNAHANGTAADLLECGFPPGRRLPLAGYSPDMHRVIEHAVCKVKTRLSQLTMAHAHTLQPTQLQMLLRHVFAQLDPGSIRRDVASLPIAWQVVAGARGISVTDAKGNTWDCTEGNWLPHDLR